MVNYLIQSSVFLSRKAYKKYGPFIGTSGVVMEYDLWLKLGRIKMPVALNDYLSSFRLSMGNISLTQYKSVLRKDYEITKKYTKNPAILFIHKLNNLGRVLTLHLANF